MTSNQLQALAAMYAEGLAAREKLDQELRGLKDQIIPELEEVGGKFDFGMMTASQIARKGTLNMKKLQIKYDISDMEIDDLRNQPSKSWVFKRKKS